MLIMEDKLNQRSDKFTIVLNDNELELFKNTRNVVNKFMLEEDMDIIYIACIKHDKDKDEKGDLKTLHYHVVMQVNKVCRIGTMLNCISNIFKCNENQITIDKCNSLCMQSRYLLHIDDFDKAKYDLFDVVTNDVDVFRRYYDMVFIRDLHDLVAVVKRYHYDLEEIMCSIGNYDKWRKYINDLIINNARKCR